MTEGNPKLSAQSPPPTSTTALAHLPSHIRFWLVALVFLVVDLWSKHWAFASLEPNEGRPFIANVVEFRRSLNDGAVFGSFTGQTGLFVFASLFALAFVFYLFAHSPRKNWCLHFALGLILSGAIGNLYDRSAIRADVISFTNHAGEPVSMIGKIVERGERQIKVGDWPEGSNPRTFQKAEIAERNQGVVRDFIKFIPRFPSWVPKLAGKDMWPWVFNIADSALVCGVITLLLTSWTDGRHRDGSA